MQQPVHMVRAQALVAQGSQDRRRQPQHDPQPPSPVGAGTSAGSDAGFRWSPGKLVGIISLPADAPDKPYKAKRGPAWVTQIRVGTTTRDATDEEETRLYQQSGRL